MYKQSASRNQRSQGIKVKHVLQICLLLAVCFWLIYQVKRAHDKKKEFDENDGKNLLDSVRKDEVVKLGRKDLHPVTKGTIIESDNHGEEDEEIEEETSVEEEDKHEDEVEENKTEVDNGEEKGGEEEEIVGHDQEKSDMENAREEGSIDEEKEQEDNDEQELKDRDSEDSNGQIHTGNASQEHDAGGSTARTHEARDENYKADDASSAVTLDAQTTSIGDDTVVLAESNEQGDVNNLEPRNNFNQNDGVDSGQSASVDFEGGATTNKDLLGATTKEQSKTIISNSSVIKMSTTYNNLADESGRVHDFSMLNENGIVSENDEDQIVVGEHKKSSESSKLEILDRNLKDNSTFPVNSDLQGFSSIVSSESESTDPNLEESRTDGVKESSNSEMKYNLTSKAEDKSSMTKNNSFTGNPEDDEASRKNESLDEQNPENSYDMKLDTEDSSNSKLSLEEKDVRTDLETLPDLEIEGINSDDAAAE